MQIDIKDLQVKRFKAQASNTALHFAIYKSRHNRSRSWYGQTSYYQTSQKCYFMIRKYPTGCQYYPRRDDFSTRHDYSVFYKIETRLSVLQKSWRERDVSAMYKTVRCPKTAVTVAGKSIASPREVANPSTTLARPRLTIYRPRVPSRSNWFSMMLPREKRRSRQFRKSDLPLRLSSQNSKLKST